MSTPTVQTPPGVSAIIRDHVYETLGYINAYDAVLANDYTFVAFKETRRSDNKWCVRISSLGNTGVVFDPPTIMQLARRAAARGEPYFTWGDTLEARAGDPRRIEFRVHVVSGKPAEVEIFLQMRQSDHSPGLSKSIRFSWPKEC